ncbi:MAG: BamA/TamA family outer membrane protein [Bacteroidetes bacterium]|nr:BamA/TamA family outer membrane protein [Bacteroidota bacterium]
MKDYRPVILLLLALFPLFANGQSSSENQTDSTETAEKSVRLFALPLAFYNPETRFGFGAAGVAAFNFKKSLASDRASQVQLGFAYTLNKQLLFYLPYQIFTPGERFTFSGEIGYYKYFFYYYGNGHEAIDNPEETYNVNFPRFRFRGLYQAYQRNFVGLQYWYDDFQNLEVEPGGILDLEKPLGVGGGAISGAGPIFIRDTRDNVFSPVKGEYVEIGALFCGNWSGSAYNYNKLVIDARKYIGLHEKSILALQYYGEFNSGNAPFYQLAQLGGNKRLRGYIEGRLRDNHYMMLQAELRQHLFWRIGMTAFVAWGGVANEISDFNAKESVVAVGLGLRVLLLKEDRINVRFDVGYGENLNFYLTVTEAF